MPAPDKPVLILGGTSEAASLAARLNAAGINVTTSLAGRTREPAPLHGKVRIGGFGGAHGLAAYLLENHIALLIDFTHPFATNISQNARLAAASTGVNLITWQRPKWQKQTQDIWQIVPSIPAAVSAIPSGARALLALGSQHIAPFAARADVHFLVRMITSPSAPLGLPNHHLLLSKPGSMEQELSMLNAHNISHVIARNSGGKAAYTKIAAARILQLPVIMIENAELIEKAESIDSLLEKIFSFVR